MLNVKCLLTLFLIIFILFISPHSYAANLEAELTPLTSDFLQERLKEVIVEEGVPTVNLTHLTINLAEDNDEFRNQFYQQIQSAITRSQTPLSINLSNSLIQGEFTTRKLGIQTPLIEEALSGSLSVLEKKQLAKEPRFKSYSLEDTQDKFIPYTTILRGSLKLNQTQFTAPVDFSNTFFLQRVEAVGVDFTTKSNWNQASFSHMADFSEAKFQGETNFKDSNFFAKAKFVKAKFTSNLDFSYSTFTDATSFSEATFNDVANWTSSRWQGEGNFSKTTWRDRTFFSKSRFLQSLYFNNASFEQTVAFRGSRFNSIVNFSDASLREQIDFSNAVFTPNAKINLSKLAFDAKEAKILGEKGVIGKAISVSTLEGNETILFNLVRNFRNLEQITDANQIEYQTKKLRREQLENLLIGLPWQKWLRFNTLGYSLKWFCLSLILLLSDYGTNFGLVLSVGIFTLAYFGLFFWFIDRYRRRFPKAIHPNIYETIWMVSSFNFLTITSLIAIFQTARQPWLTLSCLGLILLPIPLFLLAKLYLQGRYHDLLA
ncbi:MAG: pentapeptide repeat-containing protein, partial [Spirulinaceae cyanobacterium]